MISRYGANGAGLESLLRERHRKGSPHMTTRASHEIAAPSLRVAQSLTVRERQVIVMVAEGYANKEVARRLNLSEGTVKIHLHNIFQKLAENNRTALTAFAIAHEIAPGAPALPLVA
jgi:DNA-binding NarL/FixJ family response regulator